MDERRGREITVRRISATEAVISWEDWKYILGLLETGGADVQVLIPVDFSKN